MASCLLGLSSALPITERISSTSLSINFLASSPLSESSMLYTITRPRCCILGHWVEEKTRNQMYLLFF
uniref:Uncharacterized protein n=1 Tax=Mola mola TaxID=94237 RepID=A0A3Q4BRW2_MOLML